MTEIYEAITKVNEKFSETLKMVMPKVSQIYTEGGNFSANSDFLTGVPPYRVSFKG